MLQANQSSALETEEPCIFELGFSEESCDWVRAAAKSIGTPLNTFASFCGLMFNMLVILIIRECMKQQRTQAQIYLRALALSDISVCTIYIGIAIWSWNCQPCLPCSQAFSCKLTFAVMIHALIILVIWNRIMTLYITFMRAKAVSNTTNAMASQNKAEQRVLVELVFFGFIGTILTAIAGFSLMFACTFDCPFVIILPFWIITMVFLASFILVRLRRRLSISTATSDDFQKLVAIVALFFSCSLTVDFVVSTVIFCAEEKRKAELVAALWEFRSCGHILNSSVNFFIYLFASPNFRAASLRIFQRRVK